MCELNYGLPILIIVLLSFATNRLATCGKANILNNMCIGKILNIIIFHFRQTCTGSYNQLEEVKHVAILINMIQNNPSKLVDISFNLISSASPVYF